MLSDEVFEAQVALELPDRQMMDEVTINVEIVLSNVAVQLCGQENSGTQSDGTQTCAIVQEVNVTTEDGGDGE